MRVHLHPAAYCCRTFGGAYKLARAIGVHVTVPWKWCQHQDGYLPPKQLKPILTAAKTRGLDISAWDLIYGRDIDEQEPQLAAR